MPVFKAYFKISKKYMLSSMIYVAIFLVIAVVIGNNSRSSANASTTFQPTSTDIGIVDRDGSELSQYVIDYLSGLHTVTFLEDKKEVFQNELYYFHVAYIVIIPEGFEEAFTKGETLPVNAIKLPNSGDVSYVDGQINWFLQTISSFIAAGYEKAAAKEAALEILSQTSDISMALDKSVTGQIPGLFYYYSYLPYVFLGALIYLIGISVLVFRKEDLHKRNICSSLSVRSRNLQLIGGNLILGSIVYLFLTGVSFLLFRDSLPEPAMIPYYLLNSFAFLLVSLSIAYLIGTISKTTEALSAYNNVFALGLCFLGGIFVPLEVMSKQVKFLSQFTPTYWYATVNNTFQNITQLEGANVQTVWTGIFLQLCFAFAILCITMVINKKKSESV